MKFFWISKVLVILILKDINHNNINFQYNINNKYLIIIQICKIYYQQFINMIKLINYLNNKFINI